MSQFHFPRINFFGVACINPPTANNNSLYPLVIYDPVAGKACLPPRLYLSEFFVNMHSAGFLPAGTSVQSDENGLHYIEIFSIDSSDKFKQWVTTPLGSSNLDQTFHSLYKQLRTFKEKKKLAGIIPAGWNYYGGMDFYFENVKVRSVEIVNNDLQRKVYSSADGGTPADIEQLLDASIILGNLKMPKQGVMVDIVPTLALYSQVFCDLITMHKDGMEVFSGRPTKSSLRFYNDSRIVNEEGILGSSGTFYCVIPTEDLSSSKNSSIISFFKKNCITSRPIAGVFIRYNLFEVHENINIDYAQQGTKANPAKCSVLGSISPWFDDEMKSITMGRQIVPVYSYLHSSHLTSFVSYFDTARQVFSADLVGSIPEQSLKSDCRTRYETYSLGELRVALVRDGFRKVIGSITINETELPRQKIIDFGGVLEIPYSFEEPYDGFIDSCSVHIYAESLTGKEGKDVLVMKETDFMIATDQTGLYLNQHEDPSQGYLSNTAYREHCKLSIYHKGKPLEKEIPISIIGLKINRSWPVPTVSTFKEFETVRHGQVLYFPADEAGTFIYAFFCGDYPASSDDVLKEIGKTGHFINLRVLQQGNYGKYLDPDHPDYPTQITFDFIYKEVFEVFELIYPISAIITPFTESNLRRGWEYIKRRFSSRNWSSYTYMPSSRELADERLRLLNKWWETTTK